jgi:tetratricopeptide (TPR) repeat protein
MKDFRYLYLVITFILASTLIASAEVCRYRVGDVYYLTKSGVNLRSHPTKNSIIISNIETKSLGNVLLVILNDTVKDGFVNVKVEIMNLDASPELSNLNDKKGWIHNSFLTYENADLFITWDIAFYDSMISKQIQLKRENSCRYSLEFHANLLSERGIMYYQNKNFVSAIEDLTSSIKILSNNKFISRTLYFRAMSKLSLSDFYGAIDDFNKSLAACKYCCGDCKTSNLLYKQSLTLTWLCKEDILCQRAYCKIKTKNYTSALSDLNVCIQLNSEFALAYFYRGQLKDLMNDKKGCCLDLSKAGQLGMSSAYTEIQSRCN